MYIYLLDWGVFMERRIFTRSLHQVFPKVMKAFLGWGIGMIFMFIFCAFVLFLKNYTNKYVMSLGAIIFLVIGYILIDLWWTYWSLVTRERYNQDKAFHN